MFNALLTLVIKAPSSSVLAFTAFSPGERKGGGRGALRDTVEHVTRVLTTGVTRGSLHFTEVQKSHKASAGIYEGGGTGSRGGGEGWC